MSVKERNVKFADVAVDWDYVLKLQRAMIDIACDGPQDEESDRLPNSTEVMFACLLATMQVVMSSMNGADRAQAAVVFRDQAAMFAGEWAAGHVPITFENMKEGATNDSD